MDRKCSQYDYLCMQYAKTPTSDSGLEADQKVIAAHGCLATTATTALTARSARGGLESHCPPASFVQTAIDSCFDGGGVEVVKIGIKPSSRSLLAGF